MNKQELDQMISKAQRLIDSVYRELDRDASFVFNSPPSSRNSFSCDSAAVSSLRSPQPAAAEGRARRSTSPSESTASGSSQPPLSPPKTPTPQRSSAQMRRQLILSPASRELEENLNRINSICESVEQNLRNVVSGVSNAVSNTYQAVMPPRERTSDPPRSSRRSVAASRNARMSSVDEEPIHILDAGFIESSINTPRANTSSSYRYAAPAEAFIDLSDTFNNSNAHNNHDAAAAAAADDDDVIVVSTHVYDVVDLCSPFQARTTSRIAPVSSSSGSTAHRRSAIHRSRSPLHSSSTQSAHNIAARQQPATSTSAATQSINRRRSYSPAKSRQVTKSTSSSAIQCGNTGARGDATDGGGGGGAGASLTCPVCMDTVMQNRPTTTKCGHVFCEACIREAIRLTHKCPMCNTKLTNKNLLRLYL